MSDSDVAQYVDAVRCNAAAVGRALSELLAARENLVEAITVLDASVDDACRPGTPLSTPGLMNISQRCRWLRHDLGVATEDDLRIDGDPQALGFDNLGLLREDTEELVQLVDFLLARRRSARSAERLAA